MRALVLADDIDLLGGVGEGLGLPAGVRYEGFEVGGVMLGHALFAAGERMVGEGNDEDGRVDLVQQAFAGAGLDLFEAGERFEEEGDVGCRRAHVLQRVALDRGAGIAHDAEEAVEEADLIGEYIDGVVGRVGRERHPGTGQRMESAGDVKNRLDGGEQLKELPVECVELGQPFEG